MLIFLPMALIVSFMARATGLACSHEKVTKVSSIGACPFSNNVEITSTSENSVAVTIDQFFGDGLYPWIYIRFPALDGSMTCETLNWISNDVTKQLTMTCDPIKMTAMLEIYVYSDELSEEDSAMILRSCSFPPVTSMKTCISEYEVPCTPRCISGNLVESNASSGTEIGIIDNRNLFESPTTAAPSSCSEQTTGTVLETDGNIPFPEDAIEIFGWYGDTVEFELKQKWKDGTITWLGLEFDHCDVGYICDVQLGMGTRRGKQFEGNCVNGFLDLILYIHDDSWGIPSYKSLIIGSSFDECRPPEFAGQIIRYKVRLPCILNCDLSESPSTYPPIATVVPDGRPSRTLTDSPTKTPTSPQKAYPTSLPAPEPSLFPKRVPTIPPTQKNKNKDKNDKNDKKKKKDTSKRPTSAPTKGKKDKGKKKGKSKRKEKKDPTRSPTDRPTVAPTGQKSKSSSKSGSKSKSGKQVDTTSDPTMTPATATTYHPSGGPILAPTGSPSSFPGASPSLIPSRQQTGHPSSSPSIHLTPDEGLTAGPTGFPSMAPNPSTTNAPSQGQTYGPTSAPIVEPSESPTTGESPSPSFLPSDNPSELPSTVSSSIPSHVNTAPSINPNDLPNSGVPSPSFTHSPNVDLSGQPTLSLSGAPSSTKSNTSSSSPTYDQAPSPSASSISPTELPITFPSDSPSLISTKHTTMPPTDFPTKSSSSAPTSMPKETSTDPPTSVTIVTSQRPSDVPSDSPSLIPSRAPSSYPDMSSSDIESVPPSSLSTEGPSNSTVSWPSRAPSTSPDVETSRSPEHTPITFPTGAPSSKISPELSSSPTISNGLSPTPLPNGHFTSEPHLSPTNIPSSSITDRPTPSESGSQPSPSPKIFPTSMPSDIQKLPYSSSPSVSPTLTPTEGTDSSPSSFPTNEPTFPAISFPSDGPTKSRDCEYSVIDFNADGSNNLLGGGTYVHPSSWATYGVSVHATSDSGWTPGNRTRLMDTNPALTNQLVDTEFGSPNELCNIQPKGPGIGVGGIPDAVGENCVSLGNVLIIQEEDNSKSISNPGGGEMVFTFDENVDSITDIVLFNIEMYVVIIMETRAGEQSYRVIPSIGVNAVQSIQLNVDNIDNVVVRLAGRGSIASLGMCRHSYATLAPIGQSPPLTTNQPSSTPTALNKPVMTPSILPQSTTVPTIATTNAPTRCHDESDISYTEQYGSDIPFPNGAIQIISRNDDRIEFTITQLWHVEDGMNNIIAIHSHNETTDVAYCDKNMHVLPFTSLQYSAACMDGIAEVKVFVHLIDADGTDDVADCDACELPMDDSHNVVAYYFELACDPHICDSSSPSSSPTSNPTTASPTITLCPDDVELIHQVGLSSYIDDMPPIEIISRTGSSVTFRVRQTWTATTTTTSEDDGTINHLYTQYHNGPFGSTDCFLMDNVTATDSSMIYTAYCMHSVPRTVVDIWVSDGVTFNSSIDNAEVPRCCHPPSEEQIPTVQYTFILKCIAECIPPSASATSNTYSSLYGADRHLRGSG